MALPPPSQVAAIVPAAGRGERLPGAVPKQFRLLGGEPLIWHSLRRIAESGAVGRIVLVLPAGAEADFAPPGGLATPLEIAPGGPRRQDSVANGLAALGPEVEWVIVHDGARPLVPPSLVRECLSAALESGAAIAALPVVDTLKREGAAGLAGETLPREGLWQAQTPQAVRRDLLERALREAAAAGREGTDEAALLEAVGVRAKLVVGALSNLKVTGPADFAAAAAFLAAERQGAGENP
ncbi:MAG: 2-C-methyl-D-erythritol 4-phosphate cytidylyltransferase [bacterium]|nr:2-C-methyl-D-erythritol 4-phosphate cytidylyltransferase [bacterium]